jgi:hypothetical protein
VANKKRKTSLPTVIWNTTSNPNEPHKTQKKRTKQHTRGV